MNKHWAAFLVTFLMIGTLCSSAIMVAEEGRIELSGTINGATIADHTTSEKALAVSVSRPVRVAWRVYNGGPDTVYFLYIDVAVSTVTKVLFWEFENQVWSGKLDIDDQGWDRDTSDKVAIDKNGWDKGALTLDLTEYQDVLSGRTVKLTLAFNFEGKGADGSVEDFVVSQTVYLQFTE
ncbi:MAG: hypothetical protein ACFFCD_11695 [Promethearchaeota archaeon]